MANTLDLMDRLLATARVRLPGLSQSALNLELFNTLQEFFNDSNAWRWPSVVTLSPGTQQYPIFPPSGSALVQVLGVEYRGSPMGQTPSTPDGTINLTGNIQGVANAPLFDGVFTPQVVASPGGVFTYAIFFPKYIALDVPPSDDASQYPLSMLLALRMDPQCLADDPSDWPMEEWMFDTFHETWMDGILGRMMGQPNKPYSNPQLAIYHLKRFRKFIARAKQTAERGYVYNATNWQYPRWAR